MRKRWLAILRWLFPAILFLMLVRSMSKIGWLEVWEARPENPLFYLLQIVIYVLLPVSEWIIYRRLLTTDRRLTPAVFFQKRYLNTMLIEYSGEAYFLFWARKTLEMDHKRLMHVIRDSTLLSGAAGLVMLWITLLVFVLPGGGNLPEFLTKWQRPMLTAALLPVIPCLVIVFGGKLVTQMTHREMAWTFFMHLARSIINFLLEVLGWWLSGALQELTQCFDFVAMRFVLSRLPVVPGKDLIFLGAGLEMSGVMDLSRPRVAAVLIIMTIFPQTVDFLLVMTTRFRSALMNSGRRRRGHSPDTLFQPDPDLR
ncbi:hypothetical protein [Acetobacter aceti]|uniref:Flippase-like domain-containing protein n=1 Tax=Acetobacter aceti TaxID=435 RepID=A0A6S6PBZ9_ACEAC|nr:hypothetical protein [Acetobacter aceti]BCI66317.1 hypothetical protein AAJCM20276_09410 [Acetobacter aceti]